MPTDEINRQFWIQQIDEKVDQFSTPYDDPKLKEKLQMLVKKYPSYKRNQAHICSFFVKGTCNRGANWPYRHEMPDEEEKHGKGQSVEQSIRDRFHGVNDPLAAKMIGKIKKHEKPSPPENKNITTLFIGGVDETLPESDIVEFFKKYGKVKGIRIRLKSNWAFIWFAERSSAEIAIDHLYDKLFINEKQLKLLWAKDQLDPSKHKQSKPTDLASKIESEKANALTSGRSLDDGRLVIEEKGYYPSMDMANYVSTI